MRRARMVHLQTTLGRAICLVTLLAVVGCGDGGVKAPPNATIIKGKLTKGGQPLAVKPMVGLIELVFVPVDAGGDSKQVVDKQTATVSPDGTFELRGLSGRGISPGKYKIVVRQWDEFPTNDLLKGAFDETNTKIVREVGKDAVLIDVSKPEG
jgi:hypothetical protein